MIEPVIRGKHVILRRVEPSDHADIQRWQNDPEVFRWMDYERPFSLEDIRRSEERAVEEGVPLIVEAEGRGVGRIGLNRFHPRDGMASLYIFIGERDVWGKGYGIDALMALLVYAFDVLNLRRVTLWTLADNERAIAMYKRAGFLEEARLPDRSWHDGEYVDHIVMSVDREGFERARGQYGV